MERQRFLQSGFSSIGITAALAVIILVGAMIRQSYIQIQDQDAKLRFVSQAQDQSSTYEDFYDQQLSALMEPSQNAMGEAVLEEIANSYVALKEQGMYTPQIGRQLGEMMVPSIQTELAFKSYTERDFATTHDFSAETTKKYQDALQGALAPLRRNSSPEFELYGFYVTTKDPVYLERLTEVAGLYAEAADNVAHLTTPVDVLSYSVSIANALSHFGAGLHELALHVDDPIESVALLGQYNTAERSVLNAFTALNLFYANKR